VCVFGAGSVCGWTGLCRWIARVFVVVLSLCTVLGLFELHAVDASQEAALS
jgi:hypothetical protein